jgi:catechol 2,3-dioxygenase-like lactoylglutathione lyase family enzyme
MIKHLHHAGLTVADLDVSLAHYRDLLGFRVISVSDLTGPVIEQITGLTGVHLRVADLATPGGQILELIEYKSPRRPPQKLDINDAGIAHLAFEVDDIDATYARITATGIPVRSAPVLLEDPGTMWHGVWVFYSEDPDGRIVEFVQLSSGERS